MNRFSAKEVLLVLGGIILGGGIGLVVLLGVDPHIQERTAALIRRVDESGVGAPAPDFELFSIEDESVSLSSYLGKPVMINFWATWCTPCRYEMPLFENEYRALNQDLVVLAVNFEQQESEVQDFARELDLTFPILLDTEGQVARLYRVQGLPTTYFIDPEGRIGIIHIGAISETQLEGYLAEFGISND